MDPRRAGAVRGDVDESLAPEASPQPLDKPTAVLAATFEDHHFLLVALVQKDEIAVEFDQGEVISPVPSAKLRHALLRYASFCDVIRVGHRPPAGRSLKGWGGRGRSVAFRRLAGTTDNKGYVCLYIRIAWRVVQYA